MGTARSNIFADAAPRVREGEGDQSQVAGGQWYYKLCLKSSLYSHPFPSPLLSLSPPVCLPFSCLPSLPPLPSVPPPCLQSSDITVAQVDHSSVSAHTPLPPHTSHSPLPSHTAHTAPPPKPSQEQLRKQRAEKMREKRELQRQKRAAKSKLGETKMGGGEEGVAVHMHVYCYRSGQQYNGRGGDWGGGVTWGDSAHWWPCPVLSQRQS